MADAGIQRIDAEDPPGLPVARLEDWLRSEVPGLLGGPLRARLISGGRSNLTYAITDGRNEWVVRRPPLGHVLETAHDMAREHRMLVALHPTQVPVPAPVALAANGSVGASDEVLGASFYVMEHAVGEVLRSRDSLAQVADPKGLAEDLMQVLARLHELDPAEVGLGELGRPEGYLRRQLDRWQRQASASRVRDLPELDRLAQRLAADVPTPQRASIVHGDYRLDNVVVARPDDGGSAGATSGERVSAVLDWEMATLGDPLTDVASAVIWWDGMTGVPMPVAALPGDISGFPAHDLLLSSYAEAAGLDLSRLPWYVGFAYYKIAAIFEGIHYRAVQGLTVGDDFEAMGEAVPELLVRGHDALD